MSFLFDPNVAYLLLVLGFFLGVLALFTPGTGILEIGALFAIILAGYAIYNMSINWWALVMIAVSIIPFLVAIRKQKRWYWLIPAVVLLSVGSIFLFKETLTQQAIHPVFAVFLSFVITGLLWLIGRRGIEALHMRPSQDLKKLIGLTGEARSEIKNTGTVYVNGEEWTARSDQPIPSGSLVKVVDREGLVLIVESSMTEKK